MVGKVAILLSGQPRFLQGAGYKSMKEKILDKYDCDVFCHVWWTSQGGSYDTAPWSTLGNYAMPDKVPETIEKLYAPKKLRVDEPLPKEGNTVSYERVYHPSVRYNLPSMYLSMKRSYELLEEYVEETGTTYDWILRLRYDAILTAFPDLASLNKGFIYAPDYSQYHKMVGNNGLILAPKYASKIMKIYDCMESVYSSGVIFNDENMVTKHILSEKIPICILEKRIFYIELCRVDTSPQTHFDARAA